MATILKRVLKRPGEDPLVRFVVWYTDQYGKRRNKTFLKKKDAEAWKNRTVIEVEDGVHTPASDSITVAEAGQMWLDKGKTDGLEASTLKQYRQHLDLHLKPFIGRFKLADLVPEHVQKLRDQLIAGNRSRDMVKRVVVSLGSILANAMSYGKVARNVVRDQARERSKRERRIADREERPLEVGVDIPSKDELNLMLDHATGRWRPLVVTAIFTGLRASELRGLRWSDVDLEGQTLTVRQRADQWNQIGNPKSKAGKRTVPLGPRVVNALREWKLACPKGEAGLVFPNGAGKVERLANMHRRGLGAVQKAAGICASERQPKYGLHALRHAYASLLIEMGRTAKRLQAVLGHSSIQMTFDTYGHLFPNPAEDKAEMERMELRLIGKAG
jgi:integrase